jgi:hypothetical protein
MGKAQNGFHWQCECCGLESPGRRDAFSFCDAVCYAVHALFTPIGREAWKFGIRQGVGR